MNRRNILVSILCFISCTTLGRFDCIDNSHHGATKYDNGNYYLVSKSEHGPCLCPCGTRDHTILWNAQGKCIICGHYRIPKFTHFISKQKPTPPTNVTILINIKKLAAYAQKNKS